MDTTIITITITTIIMLNLNLLFFLLLCSRCCIQQLKQFTIFQATLQQCPVFLFVYKS